MTETNHIRWSDDPADACHFIGHVGTITEPAFKLYGPIDGSDRWLLSIRLKGAAEFAYGDGPDALKAEAERRLEQFVASLGAVFPAAEFEFPDEDDEPLEIRYAAGRRVRFAHPDAGWPGEGDDATESLILGAAYTIGWADIGQSKTYLNLSGVEGAFNSVLFEPVPDEPSHPEGGF